MSGYKWPFPAAVVPVAVQQEPHVTRVTIEKSDGTKDEYDIPAPSFKEYPSGSILAHTDIGSNWVLPYEMPKVIRALVKSATERHTDWLGRMYCKYIGLRIDMRTGHFVITSDVGRIDGDDETLKAFGIKADENAPLPHSNC